MLVQRIAGELQGFRFPGEPPALQVKFTGDLSQFETVHAEATLAGERLRRGDYEMSNLAASYGAGFRSLLSMVSAPRTAGSAGPALFLGRPGEAWMIRRGLAEARALFLDRGSYRHFREQALRLRRLEVRICFHQRFKSLMNGWRIFHVTLSILLLGLIGMHVWISIHVGFKWIWS